MTVRVHCSVAILALLTGSGVHGYSGGAPILACKTLVPQHLSEPEMSDPPYHILVSAWHIPKEAMHDPPIVQLMINSPVDEKFKGFIVQARCVDNDTVIGQFEPEPGEYQMIDCARGIENTATHLDAGLKTNVTLLWKPPANVSGNIVFHASVVKDFDHFWTDMRSDVLLLGEER